MKPMTAEMRTEALARATEGMAFLQKNAPHERLRRIHRRKLTMGCPYNCALAHMYGTYTKGIRALNLTDEDVVKYGFEIGECDFEELDARLQAQQEAWQETVKAHRNWKFWLNEFLAA